MYRLGHGENAVYGVSELECVCRSRETNAVRRPAARRFVRDAQSGMRLPESGSRLRIDPTFSQSHANLRVLNESPSSRLTASVGLAAATNKLEFTYSMQCISRRVLTYT